MPKITFIEHNGIEHHVVAEVGESVMQAAVSNSVPGILGDCGGSCSCATCHVYVDDPWQANVLPPAKDEQLMLECVAQPQENSRLGCQMRVTPELDGLVLRVPEA